MNAIKTSSIAVVSPNEIQFTLAQTTNMTGQKIQVVNPDGSQDTYFSYLRGVPLVQSGRPLLQTTVPIFSSVTHSTALFGPLAAMSQTQFSGVAVQNPSTVSADVTVSLYSAQNVILGSSTITVPPGYRFMAETSELIYGIAPPAGSFIAVSSNQPVQSFGFTADGAQSTVLPFAAIASQP